MGPAATGRLAPGPPSWQARAMSAAALPSLVAFAAAAIAEIAGCFAFWAWLRLGKSALWLAPGLVALAFFAWALAQVGTEHAGRAYAAYGGVYILASIGWLWAVEGQRPDRWDMTGVALCLAGAAVILLGPRE